MILIFLHAFVFSVVAVIQPSRAKNGMVVTADKYATAVGVQILEKGGNAIDAAVAIGFVLAVSYPQAGNIGGGGFMIIRNAEGDVYALDYREKAPRFAHQDMYLDENNLVIEGASTSGYLSSGVPGTVSGLYHAHEKLGSMNWVDLLQPAIDLALEGIIVDRFLGESLEENLDDFLPYPSTMDVFTNSGRALQEGERLIQKDIARTLQLIQNEGPAGFYEGETADKIVSAMIKNNGLITAEDLESYDAVWREPINFNYRGYDIYSMSLPSSGGILIAEILNTLENVNLSALGHNSSSTMHLWIETEKQAYADRAKYLGDVDFIQAPIDMLTAKKYGHTIFQSLNPFYARSSQVIKPGRIEHLETTHYSVVDGQGNTVSNTYTLNGYYGSGVIIEGTGILMNNEMDDFVIKPGYPNLYGLVGGEANAIEPEKRMLSSMTPTIVVKDNKTIMIAGSPGGSVIITSVAQVLSNVIDFKMNIREAVEAPRFHHQWLPNIVKYEKNGFSLDVLLNLKKKGHQLEEVNDLGNVQAILWDEENSEWTGWSDPRRNGVSKGY
jgi:gamma-glutamyltranspeptidase/glutathione hydrolase